MKTQIDIHRTIPNRDMDEESDFSSFRYELENGARQTQFVISLLVSSAVLLTLTLFFLRH